MNKTLGHYLKSNEIKGVTFLKPNHNPTALSISRRYNINIKGKPGKVK